MAAIVAAVAAGSPVLAHAAKRIASINVCADQYLLALVRREDIVALSPFADDATWSASATDAKGIPKVKDDAESVLALKPDLVVASAYTRRSTIALLKRLGFDVFVVPDALNFDQLREQIQAVSEALDAREKGNALIRALDASLARLEGQGNGRSVLYLDRGFATGPRTLIGAALDLAGLSNAAESLGIESVGPASLEIALITKPDIIITSGSDAQDQAALSLRHPAIASLTGTQTIHLPVSHTVCPGPGWIGALNRLASGLSSD